MHNRRECVPALQTFALNSSSLPYREQDGSMFLTVHTRNDFLLVPMKVANDFITVAQLILYSGVCLDCSAGPIVDIV